jgi:hypothetical protein
VIEEVWLAWTENPADPLANDLRKRHHDQLVSLVEARRKLGMAIGETDPCIGRLDRLLGLEFGGESEAFLPQANLEAVLAAADPSKSEIKLAIKYIKDKAFEKKGKDGVQYLRPGQIWAVPCSAGARAYVMGPPRSEKLLRDEDPAASEAFPGQGLDSRGLSFSAAVRGEPENFDIPFSEQYRIPIEPALEHTFFQRYYGSGDALNENTDKVEVPTNAAWRRIDAEWLYSAESLALKLNTGTNNTSLVLAFELPATKKVLLFAGDAQRGNWISWGDQLWKDGDRTITAREILERAVLYKAGHHGSHNATLNGKLDDTYPNINWMGKDGFAGEFTAMITAVNEWAVTKNRPPWYHPLPAIKAVLAQKAQGRVLQMDEPKLVKPDSVPDAVWKEFTSRVKVRELFFEFSILDQ